MSSYVIAVDEYGECYVWGAGVGSADGALRSPACLSQPRAQPGPVLLEVLPSHVRVKEVACGLGHALLLAYSGQCFSWGNGGNGRLGLGDVHDRISAAAVAPFSEGDCVASVQCGASHSMALTAGGLVYCWGKVCLHSLHNLFFSLSATLLSSLLLPSISLPFLAQHPTPHPDTPNPIYCPPEHAGAVRPRALRGVSAQAGPQQTPATALRRHGPGGRCRCRCWRWYWCWG